MIKAQEIIDLCVELGHVFEDALDGFQKIVQDKSMGKVDGIQVDLTTANFVLQVYQALSPDNQKKFRSMSAQKMIDVTMKLVGKESFTEEDILAESDKMTIAVWPNKHNGKEIAVHNAERLKGSESDDKFLMNLNILKVNGHVDFNHDNLRRAVQGAGVPDSDLNKVTLKTINIADKKNYHLFDHDGVLQ